MAQVGFSEPARRVLQAAQEEAVEFGYREVDTEQLLFGIVTTDCEAKAVLSDLIDTSLFRIPRSNGTIVAAVAAPSRISLSPGAQKVIELAAAEANRLNHPYVGTEHLLIGLLREGSGAAHGILTNLGITLDDVYEVLSVTRN